jgi:hypothetical protein
MRLAYQMGKKRRRWPREGGGLTCKYRSDAERIPSFGNNTYIIPTISLPMVSFRFASICPALGATTFFSLSLKASLLSRLSLPKAAHGPSVLQMLLLYLINLFSCALERVM